MLAVGDRESSLAEDLPGTRVLFDFSAFIGFTGLVHRGRKRRPRGKMFFRFPMCFEIGAGFSKKLQQCFIGQPGYLRISLINVS